MAIEVATAQDLYNMRNDLQADYVQVADIDLSGYSNWEPIGNENEFDYDFPELTPNFTYDGQDYKITGLTITNIAEYGIDFGGLFGELRCYNYPHSVTIRNINLEEVFISDNPAYYIGGILGGANYYGDNAGKIRIENCKVTGDITGDSAGGIVSYFHYGLEVIDCQFIGNINCSDMGGGIGAVGYSGKVVERDFTLFENCYSEGELRGGDDIGGICGWVEFWDSNPIPDPEPVFVNCHTKMNIHSDTSFGARWSDGIGGFIGQFFGGSMYNCSATGNVIGLADSTWGAGGFVGRYDAYYEDSKLEKCYATGDVQGNWSVAGFIGYYAGTWSGEYEAYNILDCYTRSDILGGEGDVGGFVGWIEDKGGTTAKLQNCYSANTISLSVPIEEADGVGGFCGNIDSDYSIEEGQALFKDCYFDSDLADFEDKGWGIPRSTSEMTYPHSANTYLNWDFNDIWFIYSHINDGYPQFEIHSEEESIYFINEPDIKYRQKTANKVIVNSPSATATAVEPNLSEDKMIERVVTIEQGDIDICRQVAEKLLEQWSKEKLSVSGEIRLRSDIDFKKKITIIIPNENFEKKLKVQNVEYDVINQRARVTCGDSDFNENDLITRILEGLV